MRHQSDYRYSENNGINHQEDKIINKESLEITMFQDFPFNLNRFHCECLIGMVTRNSSMEL